MSGNIAYIGIGSNLGNVLQNVGEAIEILRDLPIPVWIDSRHSIVLHRSMRQAMIM